MHAHSNVLLSLEYRVPIAFGAAAQATLGLVGLRGSDAGMFSILVFDDFY